MIITMVFTGFSANKKQLGLDFDVRTSRSKSWPSSNGHLKLVFPIITGAIETSSHFLQVASVLIAKIELEISI